MEKKQLYDNDDVESRRNLEGMIRKGRLYEQVALLIVILISSATLVTSFSAWRNSELRLFMVSNEEGIYAAQPPYNPPLLGLAKRARYMAHYMNWAVVSTISTIDGMPFGSPVSISDGPVDNSTGVPYIYITVYDPTATDVNKNSKASFTFSEAQTDYCSRNKFETEFPLCARLTLCGNLVNVTADEILFAKKAVFSRHPGMDKWPSSHHFFFLKLNITRVHVLDMFGPSHDIPVKDYFDATPDQ